ncbi:MAG TPA: NAD(P)/FAD-dependent oxidoreductase [Pedococcus sp.]|nr:NAD(P)/FAD-dependent oxidoreductase [Pedococcus sp.]
MRTFDLAVIGLGPGGEHVAGSLAQAGLDVLGVDHGLVGGECPYWGCVPSKMMLRAAGALEEARRVPQLAGEVGTVTPRWSLVADRIRDEATDNWDDTVAVDRFTGKGGTFVRGTGRVTSANTLEVDGVAYGVRQGIVVATGTRPTIPPIPGLHEVEYWTNREVMRAAELPKSLTVLGGGAIGVEISQALARFGVQVVIVESAPGLLALEEPEAARAVEDSLRQDGVTIRTGARADKVSANGNAVAVTLSDGSVLSSDRLLVATGRHVDIGDVGLDAVGVDPHARAVPVDEWGRVGPGVWALGDITGHGAFTHMSMYQAGVVIRDVLGQGGPPADYRAIPRVTFTDPELGSVGLSEAQAREALDHVLVGTSEVSSSTRGWIHKTGPQGIIKLVADGDRGVLVGGTAMGPAGGEVLGLITLAVHAQVQLDQLRSMIYAYPTFHRAVEGALSALG